MPVYEYYCADCDRKFDLLTTYEKSKQGVECVRCGGTNVRKLISVFARAPRGGDADFGDFDEGPDGSFGGGCSCGGACSCGGHN